MAKHDWLQEIDFEKYLSKDMKKILDVLGLDNFTKLCECHDGRTLYIPSDPYREAKREYVIKNFDGSNAKDLAKKLGVTTRTVYNYLGEHRQDMRDRKKG